MALTARARVAIAAGEPEQAERDAHDALVCAAELEAHLASPTSSNASAFWPAGTGVTAKPPGSSPRRTASGNASAWSASRSTTPTTKPRWRRCETRWARTTLIPHGPRARPCPPRRRSPTPNAAAAYQRPSRGWDYHGTAVVSFRLVSGTRQQRHRRKAFRVTAHGANPLTHVYTKLGLTSRVQLAQEAAH